MLCSKTATGITEHHAALREGNAADAEALGEVNVSGRPWQKRGLKILGFADGQDTCRAFLPVDSICRKCSDFRLMQDLSLGANRV